MQAEQQQEWWRRAFQADYLQRYAHRTDAAAVAEVAGCLQRFAASDGPILDACCGNGRHLRALRAQGLQVFGFDFSFDLLADGKQQRSLDRLLVRADMRQLPYKPQSFSAISLFFTAFGYFSDIDNQQTLNGFAALLKPQGCLLLDLPNAAQVRAELVPENEKQLHDGSTVIERRHLDGDYVVKQVFQPGAEQAFMFERVRLYEWDEIVQLAQVAGLQAETHWPSLRGPEHDDQRMVCWLRR